MFESSVTTTPQKPDWLPWGLTASGVACAVFVLIAGVLPARSVNDELTRELTRLDAELVAATLEAERQREAAEQLREEWSRSQEEQSRALREEQQATAELEALRGALRQPLRREIDAGDVVIEMRDGRLVVDVASELLFARGQTRLTRKGRQCLRLMAKSMRQLPTTQVFQVEGHTDSSKNTKYAKRYPTNWELSTGRATRVARFLEEHGGIRGEQLIAAGFSQYRPASSNRTGTGRRKNRRIEIVLLRN